MQTDNKITANGLWIWTICASFFIYEFMTRVLVGSFQTPIMDDFNLSIIEFALISSTLYQVAYGFMQLPVGFLTDKFGLKKTLTIATASCGISILLFIETQGFWGAASSRVLLGLGSSFGFIGVLVAVYEWLPRNKTATFIGLSQFIGTLGPMLAAGPIVSMTLALDISWRTTFFTIGIIGFLLSGLIFIFVRNNPYPPQIHEFRVLKKGLSFADSVKKIVTQKQIWLIAGFCALNYFAIEYLAENEGIHFLMAKGFTYQFASYMLTVAWLGYAIGCPLLGIISDLLKRRKPIMIAGISLCLLALVAIFYLPLNQIGLIGCFFALGIGSSSQSTALALIAEQCSESYRAAALGFSNGFVLIIAASNAPIVGKILTLLHHTEQSTLPSVSHYQRAFAVVIGFVFLGLLIGIFGIRESFCKMQREPKLLNY